MKTLPALKSAQQIVLSNGTAFSLRASTSFDAEAVTHLIHRAFDIWKEQGLRLSPMFQTTEQTSKHLAHGIVAEDQHGEIVGTVSFDQCTILNREDLSAVYWSNGEPVNYIFYSEKSASLSGRFLSPLKLAVDRELSGRGLGSALFRSAERLALDAGYEGTVKEATWLYDWYVRIGYNPVASHRYPGSMVDTILLIKRF